MKWHIGKLLRGVAQLLVPVIAQAALDVLTKQPRVAKQRRDANQLDLPLDPAVSTQSEL